MGFRSKLGLKVWQEQGFSLNKEETQVINQYVNLSSMLNKFLSIITEIGAFKPEESLLTWNKLKSIKN